MEEKNTGTEKRQYPRVETQIPVRYRIQGDTAETLVSGSLTGNVSADGLMFRTKEYLSAASNLTLELDFPTQTEPITATCKVAWIMSDNGEEGYAVGNRFMEITRKDQELIAQYVKSLQ